MTSRLAGRLFDAIEGGQDALAHVGVKALVGEAFVRVDPGNDEHGQALRDRPSDERLLRIEVEDIELVDPRRHDQERALVDLRRRRLVLDQLDELVAEDDLAGRHRHVDAELERARVRLADAQFAFPRLDVLGEHLQSADEILAALFQRRADQLGIGADKVRWRERGRHLAQIELRLVSIVRLELVGAPDEIVRPARRQHVGLFDEIEEGIVPPFGVREPLVRAVGFGDRLHRRALEAPQRCGPQVDELSGERRLRLDRPLGVGHVIFGDVADRPDHFADFVGESRLDLARLARPHVGGHRLAGVLDRAGDVAGERLDVGHRILGAEPERASGARGRGRGRGAAFGAGACSTAAGRAGGGAAACSGTAGFAAAECGLLAFANGGGGEAGGGSGSASSADSRGGGAGGVGSDTAAAGRFADGAFRGAVDAFRSVVAAFGAAVLGSGAASDGGLPVAPCGSA